jgi:CHAT domain-containing protein/tetratricopeptide (TPR) repeat protein
LRGIIQNFMKGLYRFLQALLLQYLFFFPLAAQTPDVPLAELSWQELTEKIEALVTKGKFQESLPFAREALAKALRDSSEASLDYGSSLDFLGYVLHHSGYFTEAEQTFFATVAHARIHLGESHEDYITRLSNLAMLHMDMGELAKAASELESAVHLAEKNLGDDNPYVAILINNLGLAYEKIGHLDQALKYYLLALDRTEKTVGKDNVRYAIRLSNVAAIYRKTGKNEKALEFSLRALPIFEKTTGKTHPYYASGLSALVSTYTSLSRFEDAFPLSEELLGLMEKWSEKISPEMYDFVGAVSNLYFKAGQYQRCVDFSKQMFTRYSEIFPQHYARHTYLLDRIMASLEKMGHFQEAAVFASMHNHFSVEELVNISSKFSEEEQLRYFQTYRQVSDYHALLFAVQHPEFPDMTESVYDYEMTVKGLSLTNRRQLFQSLRENHDTEPSAKFEAWQHLQNTISQQYALAPGKRQINLDSLLRLSNELERNLVQVSEPFRLASQKIQWQDVKASLLEGEAALEFGQVKNEKTDSSLYYAWVVRPGDGSPKQVFLFEEKEIGNLVATRRLYNPIHTPEEKNLQELLWKPLEPLLKGVTTLYFAPVGVLYQLNLGAVPVSVSEILADRIQLHRLVSTRQVIALKKADSRIAPKSALVLGGIRYETDSLALVSTNLIASSEPLPGFESQNRGAAFGEEWSFLTGSLQEANTTRTRLQSVGAKVVLANGFQASEGFFKRSVQSTPSPTLMHLATHGFFLSFPDSNARSGFAAAENPMARAGLVLSGANRAWSGGEPLAGQEDGILTALEISRLDLSGTELAVLSACGTGQGKVEAGEGVLGLQRAFKMAGTHYVIMTLWNVQDHDAQQFMDLFYEQWLSQKKSVPEAFRVAQRKMRVLHSRPFQPMAWAGFLLLE